MWLGTPTDTENIREILNSLRPDEQHHAVGDLIPTIRAASSDQRLSQPPGWQDQEGPRGFGPGVLRVSRRNELLSFSADWLSGRQLPTRQASVIWRSPMTPASLVVGEVFWLDCLSSC